MNDVYDSNNNHEKEPQTKQQPKVPHMITFGSSDSIGRIAEILLRVIAGFIQADTYSLYLYYDLFVPIANYFPSKEYPLLDAMPLSAAETKRTPLVHYMQKYKKAVHNYMPEVKELWINSPRCEVFRQHGLEYLLAAPMFYNGQWLGSINLFRSDREFDGLDVRRAEDTAKMVILFFENGETLLTNNAYVTMNSTSSVTNISLVHGFQNDKSNKVEELSRREREVLELATDGLTYNEISQSLYISVNTVKHHLKNIYRKLGTNSRSRLIHLLYQ